MLPVVGLFLPDRCLHDAQDLFCFSVRERSRHAREDDEVTLNHLSVTVDTSLFPDTLKMKVQFMSDVVDSE